MSINALIEKFKTKDPFQVKLDENIVEHGEVYKYPIINNSILEISILQIAPHSKIREHFHKDDSELYFFIDEKEYSICKQGESHNIENNSDKWIQVVSLKTKYSELVL